MVPYFQVNRPVPTVLQVQEDQEVLLVPTVLGTLVYRVVLVVLLDL